MATTETTEYTLSDVAPMLAWPVEALLGVEYDDPRVTDGPGRNEVWLDRGDGYDPDGLRSAWRELRAAVKRGAPSPDKIKVRLRSVSRGVDGFVLV